VAGDRRWAWEAAAVPWAGAATDAAPYDTATRVNPPLRTPADAAAIALGIRDGTVDAIATDHAPHTAVAKAVEYGEAATGISGIETALGVLLAAVAAGVVDLTSVARALTLGPARVLGSALEAGPATGFDVGAAADLVVVDRGGRWAVTEASLCSKGKNSPLLGRELRGRVLLTVAGGRFAYLDAGLDGG
jgi:dihydroorotase